MSLFRNFFFISNANIEREIEAYKKSDAEMIVEYDERINQHFEDIDVFLDQINRAMQASDRDFARAMGKPHLVVVKT